MPINRTLIKSGPAILTWNGATLYFKDGITIEENRSTFDVKADHLPASEKRADDRFVTLKGTPVGAWENLAVLFPWLSAYAGARLFGATDKPAVVHFLDGDRFTYHNAALAEMPALSFSPVKTLLGGITLECRNKNNVAADDAAALFTRDTANFTDTSFDLANIPTLAYTLNFGAAPWDDFQTADGVEIQAKASWREITADSFGVVEKELTGLEVSASFTPLALAQSAIDSKLGLQNSAAAIRGARVAATLGADFILSASGVYVAVKNAILRASSMQSAIGRQRHGKLEAVASLALSAGAPVAQLIVDTEAP